MACFRARRAIVTDAAVLAGAAATDAAPRVPCVEDENAADPETRVGGASHHSAKLGRSSDNLAGRREADLEISLDVVDVLEPDRETHEAGGHAT